MSPQRSRHKSPPRYPLIDSYKSEDFKSRWQAIVFHILIIPAAIIIGTINVVLITLTGYMINPGNIILRLEHRKEDKQWVWDKTLKRREN
jgi:hypothetical protein